MTIDGIDYEAGCDMIDVTSMNRPATSWRVTDAAGHEHRWYVLAKIDVPRFEPGVFICQSCGRLESSFVGPCTMNVERDGAWQSCGGWFMVAEPATSYNPSAKYDTPTLVWIKDGETFYEDDDEPHEVGHTECRLCGEHITPRNTADDHTRYIPGLKWFRINGQSVTAEEFAARTAHLGRE